MGEGAACRCRVASLAAFRLQPEKVGECRRDDRELA